MVAQSVEQRTFNPLVEGSSPSHPTTKSLIHNNFISENPSELYNTPNCYTFFADSLVAYVASPRLEQSKKIDRLREIPTLLSIKTASLGDPHDHQSRPLLPSLND